MTRVGTVAAYALVLVLAVELALWGAFLVGARPLGHALPVAALVALVGNLVVGRAGARVRGRRAGAVVPGGLGLAVALVLGSKRPEGDVVVTSTFRGLAFLFVGTLAAAAAAGATPGAPDSR
ncbi:MAG: DUF6113 family protein [Mycobacteriales bacterium]